MRGHALHDGHRLQIEVARGTVDLPAFGALLARWSGQSDLVLVGLRQPRKDESAKQYFGHYQTILDVLPTSLLVASSPSFEGAPVLFDDLD